MMKPEDLTIEMLEDAYGHRSEEWHGACSQLTHVAIHVLGYGSYAYGHFLGDVDPNGHWTPNGMNIQRHAWVVLDGGRILDPTRWSFENVDPYIYIGQGDDYDEGGNQVREALRTPCPSRGDGEPLCLEEAMCSRHFFEEMTRTPFNKITARQAAWVANSSYDNLGIAVAPVYETLITNGLKAFIPIDNYNRALREGRIKSEPDAKRS